MCLVHDPSEQFDLAGSWPRSIEQVLALAADDLVTLCRAQLFHADGAAEGEIDHAARHGVAKVLGEHAVSFHLQPVAHEIYIAVTYVHADIQHVPAAEQLHLEPLAVRAELEHPVDEAFHG